MRGFQVGSESRTIRYAVYLLWETDGTDSAGEYVLTEYNVCRQRLRVPNPDVSLDVQKNIQKEKQMNARETLSGGRLLKTGGTGSKWLWSDWTCEQHSTKLSHFDSWNIAVTVCNILRRLSRAVDLHKSRQISSLGTSAIDKQRTDVSQNITMRYVLWCRAFFQTVDRLPQVGRYVLDVWRCWKQKQHREYIYRTWHTDRWSSGGSQH